MQHIPQLLGQLPPIFVKVLARYCREVSEEA